ncbi:acyl-CoA dehydrogenase [Pseudooceanicola sp. 216_PA32_1]|uniref:Acyl-CoA dehydrogenase n=1 Tax=Pseudooceanicola pacificus TaxID=2676438 RepID=A0A844W6G8_9RHOB|nr:acyl-CoA dehydrogenase family protein [Pseudooceanicola pacificus]MWB78411.1 acyl-CoA dehydrogenase [Pseudooceanicola pacificus]
MKDDASVRDFRAETRAWLEQNCPPEMRLPIVEEERCWGGRKWTFHSDAQRLWLERMADRGWTAPTWPREYGGGGLSHAEAKILREEMDALNCRPPLERVSQALGLLGPTILAIGTDAQKARFLPPIARGETRWCQGYSEPNAGSDLASVRTRARDEGDHFVINGQKIWTSHAHLSDWMFALVRTGPDTPKHAGITFVLLDMDSPGVDVRPIELISGKSAFCETFLTDVKVPKENVLGEVNDGWNVSKILLSNERNSISTARNFMAERSIGLTALDRQREGPGHESDASLLDTSLRERIAAYEASAWAFSALSERAGDLAAAGESTAAHASVLKIHYARLNQLRTSLMLEIGGSDYFEWDAPVSDAARLWLRAKANSIEGGSTEIQLNILSKRVLGLPNL